MNRGGIIFSALRIYRRVGNILVCSGSIYGLGNILIVKITVGYTCRNVPAVIAVAISGSKQRECLCGQPLIMCVLSCAGIGYLEYDIFTVVFSVCIGNGSADILLIILTVLDKNGGFLGEVVSFVLSAGLEVCYCLFGMGASSWLKLWSSHQLV